MYAVIFRVRNGIKNVYSNCQHDFQALYLFHSYLVNSARTVNKAIKSMRNHLSFPRILLSPSNIASLLNQSVLDFI